MMSLDFMSVRMWAIERCVNRLTNELFLRIW